jgi:TP901 family phage tail tape measure protein
MSQSIQIPVTQVGLEQSIAAAMRRVGNSAQINLGTSSRQINALSQPLGRITGQADEFSKSMAAANARVLAFGASASIIVGVSQAMSGLLASTIKVEKSLVEINAVLGESSTELDKISQGIFNVAKNTGKSFAEVSEAALELARQGLDTEDTLIRLNDAMVLSRLSGLEAAKSVEGLTAAFNSFKSSGISTAEILNNVVAAAQAFAVSEKDIIEGLGRSASVANLAGVSFNELASIITAIQEKTARGGAVIGNSLKTIFARIQDKSALDDLRDMGIAVTNLQGEVLPALKILENLAAKMDTFSQLEKADISKKLGGIYQLDKLLAALSDLSSESSVYRKTLEEIEIAGNSAYKKNAVLNETLASVINKVSVSAEQLGAKLGEIGVTDSLKNLLGFFNSLLEGVQKVLGEESGLGTLVRGLVKGLGNLFTGPGLALFGAIILKLSRDLVQFGFASLKAFFGIGQAAKEVQNIESAISQVLARNVDLQQKLFQLEGNRAGQLKLITGALVDQEALLRRSANISSGLAAPLYNVGVRASDSGLRIKNKAGGYMPAVAKETQAINSGVGGARRGDKPVVIPNFNFGQGAKGTVVAHTGEYVVPNFGGGKGSAIFNRDMVQKMGLPRGAQKITASGGFIPNFAEWYDSDSGRVRTSTQIPNAPGNWEVIKSSSEQVRMAQAAGNLEKSKLPGLDFYLFRDEQGKIISGGRGATIRNVLSRAQSQATTNKQAEDQKIIDAGFYNLNADALGGILLVSPKFGKAKGSLDTSLPIGKIPFFNQENSPPIDKNKYIKLNGIKTTNTPSGRDLKSLQGNISELFAAPIVDLAYKLYGNIFDPASGGEFVNKLKSLDPYKKQQLLPAAAQGDIFEAAGKVALNNFANLESLFGSAEQSRPFDFQNASAMQKMFGVNTKRGEAKRGGEKNFSSSKQVSGIIKKVFNDPEYSPTALASLRKQGAFNFSKAQKAASATNAAGGFIPNFAGYPYKLSTFAPDLKALGKDAKNVGVEGYKNKVIKNPPAIKQFQAALQSGKNPRIEGDDRISSVDFKVERIKIDDANLANEITKTKGNGRKATADFERLAIQKLGYNNGAEKLFGKNTSAVDGYRLGKPVIDLLEVKAGAWTPSEVQNKFGRFVPENVYNSGIATELGSEKYFKEGVRQQIDTIRLNNVLAIPDLEGYSGKISKSKNKTQRDYYPPFSVDQLSKSQNAKLAKSKKREARRSAAGGFIPNFSVGRAQLSNLISRFADSGERFPEIPLLNASQNEQLRSRIHQIRLAGGGSSRPNLIDSLASDIESQAGASTLSSLLPSLSSTVKSNLPSLDTSSRLAAIDNIGLPTQTANSNTVAKVAEKSGSDLSIIGGKLKVGFLRSRSGNPLFEIARKIKSREITSIDAGPIVGPRIPDLIVGLKSLVERLRLKDPSFPRIPIEGTFNPKRLADTMNAASFKKTQARFPGRDLINTQSEYFRAGSEFFLPEDLKNLGKAYKALGTTSRKDEFLYLKRLFPEGLAEGYLPNFANPLQDAVGREMAAGVPASQIYIDKNSSLKNAMNPMGLMVANRRDEPAGGFQGISRARKEGANPMMYGAASGFVPNYAPDVRTKAFSGGYIPNFAISLAQMKNLRKMGGEVDRKNKDSYYYSNLDKKISVGRGEAPKEWKGEFSKFFIFLHELGHYLDHDKYEKSFDRRTNKKIKNNLYSKTPSLLTKTSILTNEKRANLLAIQAMRKVGISKSDIQRYINFSKQAYKTYMGFDFYVKPEEREFYDEKPYGKGRVGSLLKKPTDIPPQKLEVFEALRRKVQRISNYGLNNAAGGFVPNFADPLQDAVGREMAAGVPASQIYIDKNSSLKNAMNPMGLMVANRRDEPAGGFQGISRARKEGANPMTYGAADGFVPNYANLKIKDFPSTSTISAENLTKLNEEIKRLNKSIKDTTLTYDSAEQELKAFIGGLKNTKGKAISPKTVDTISSVASSSLKDQKAGGNRDMLGTIFAVQAGLSVLTGATEGATNSLAKYTNVVSDSVGSATSALFAFQGLSSALPKFAGFLGPAGIALSATTALYKIGTGVLNEYFGINKIVANSLLTISKAAEEASVNLSKLDPETKADIEKESKDILAAGLKTGKFQNVPTAITIGGGRGGYSQLATVSTEIIARFEKDVSGKLAENTLNSIAEARGAGVASAKINEAIQKYSDDALITLAEASELPKTLANLIRGVDELAKTAIDEIETSKDLDLVRARAAIAAMKPADIAKQADPSKMTKEERAKFAGYETFEAYQTGEGGVPFKFKNAGDPTTDPFGFLRKRLKDSGLEEGPALNKRLEDFGLKQQQIAKAKQEEEKEAIKQTSTSIVQAKLKNALAMSIAKARSFENDSLGQQLLKGQELGALDETALRNLQDRIALRAVDQELQDATSNLIQEQISQVKKITADSEKAQELQRKFNSLSAEDLQTKKTVNELLDETSALLSQNSGLTDRQKEALKITLDQLFDENKLKKDNLGLTQEQTAEYKEQAKQLDIISQASKRALAAQSFSREIGTTRSINANDLRVRALESSKLGASDTQVRQIDQQIAAIKENTVALEQASAREKVFSDFKGQLLENNKITDKAVKADIDNQIRQADTVEKLEDLALILTASMQGVDSDSAIGIMQGVLQKFRQDLTTQDEASKQARALAAGETADAGRISPVIDALEMFGRSLLETSQIIDQKIEDIRLQQLTSISGRELLQANYDIETLNMQRGQTPEDAARIARERQNKSVSQLFNEEFAKTDEERAFDLKKTIVDGSVQFKNNMIEGIMSAIEGASSLKDGLRSAAYEFVKTINQRLMSNLVDQVVGGRVQSGSGASSAGIAQGIGSFFSSMFMASGGMVNGGSGSKDDVPAMLMGGEYVVNKKAVSKYGAQFLESINNGTLAGYAQGGSVQRGPQGNFYTPGTFGQGAIEGKKNLLDFATQTGTTGQFDKVVSQLGYQAVDLEPESSRLSVSGMRNSPQFEATQSAKQQAFDLYLQQYNQEIEAKKAAKEQKKALKRQLLMLAVTSALGAVGSVASTGAKTALANLPKDAGALQKLMTGVSGAFKGGNIDGTGQMAGGLFNLFSGNFSTAFRSGVPLKAGMVAGSGYSSIPSGIARSGAGVVHVLTPKYDTPDGQPPTKLPENIKLAIGGKVPSTSGIDTVPAMLSGGEFVMNRSAVQGIGASNLQSMNSGGTSITSEETSKKLNEQLLAKLDELISASGSTGDITINVAPSGQSSQETSQNPSEERQQLARQIKDAVLQIINDEKRIGGSLRR